MKLKVFDVITVEGEEMECALYTAILLEAFKLKNEHDKKKEFDDWLAKYGDMTFEELMKKEL